MVFFIFSYTREMNATIIISDLHLGTNNIHHKKLQELLRVINNFDQVILNGDFLDDLWDYSETIASAWSPLFDLLSQKYVIYVFGNHDPDTESLRQATTGFVDEYAHEYMLPVADQELVVMHGQTIYPRPVDRLYLPRKTWHGKIVNTFIRTIWYAFYPVLLAFRFFIEKHPGFLAQMQRNIIRLQNERMKRYAKNNLKPHQILVCGHSHLPEFSPEEQFINEGSNSYERVEYLSIRDNKMELVIQEL